MKNFLIQGEIKEENRKIDGNVLLIDRKCNSNILRINKKFAELLDQAKYASLLKLIELVKKLSNLTKTRKEKPHCLISHSLIYFIEHVRQLCF